MAREYDVHVESGGGRATLRVTGEFDLAATEPSWALGYEWDIVLGRGGTGTTPLEGTP